MRFPATQESILAKTYTWSTDMSSQKILILLWILCKGSGPAKKQLSRCEKNLQCLIIIMIIIEIWELTSTNVLNFNKFGWLRVLLHELKQP